MKRIVFIIFLFVTFFNANAQLVIKYQDDSKTEKVCSVRMTYSDIYYNSSLGYKLYINSSNRFDNRFCIELGQDKETALETLNVLIKIGEEQTNISAQSSNENLIIIGRSAMNINAIFISGNKHAGDCSLNVSELKRAVNKVKEYKE